MSEIVRDEWTPALGNCLKALSAHSQRLALAEIGSRMVLRIRRRMVDQIGFATGQPYKKLKIKWRYHRRKVLAGDTSGRGTVSKFPVTPDTKALIDRADLLRSWAVTDLSSTRVDISPSTALEKLKAYYNTNRGEWEWLTSGAAHSGENSADEALRIWAARFDRDSGFTK